MASWCPRDAILSCGSGTPRRDGPGVDIGHVDELAQVVQTPTGDGLWERQHSARPEKDDRRIVDHLPTRCMDAHGASTRVRQIEPDVALAPPHAHKHCPLVAAVQGSGFEQAQCLG